jgi:hypothetical protein
MVRSDRQLKIFQRGYGSFLEEAVSPLFVLGLHWQAVSERPIAL